jgi:hypothetical protein
MLTGATGIAPHHSTKPLEHVWQMDWADVEPSRVPLGYREKKKRQKERQHRIPEWSPISVLTGRCRA